MTKREAVEILEEVRTLDDSMFAYSQAYNDALDMAIEALKAQEPRVMTLEEYEAWTDLPFIERDPVFHEGRTKRGTVTCWVNTMVCSVHEYGNNDRCWTSRPTDEQMEETPWP